MGIILYDPKEKKLKPKTPRTPKMLELTCPFHDCAVVTSHVKDEVAVALFNAHVGTHTAGQCAQ